MGGSNHRLLVAQLAVRYGYRLRRFLFTRARNASDVPDLAQEVFLRMMRVGQLEGIRSPEAYLFTIASHVAHQHSLRESHTPKSVDIMQLMQELQLASPDDPIANTETLQQMESVRQVLEELPPKISTTLLLHRFAGMSIEEIGKHLGVARPTAKKYLAQALLHCRKARERAR